MPPGRFWPRRKKTGPLSRRHPVTVTFGKPIKAAADDRTAVTDRIAKFFEQAPGRRRAGSAGRPPTPPAASAEALLLPGRRSRRSKAKGRR
jgi:hypothetical protein